VSVGVATKALICVALFGAGASKDHHCCAMILKDY
jgi:hypothetical protein